MHTNRTRRAGSPRPVDLDAFARQVAAAAGTPRLHLGHSNIGITDTYLRGAGADETLDQVYEQAAPMVPATAMLALSGLGQELAAA